MNKDIVSHSNDYCLDFVRGVDFLKAYSVTQALQQFQLAYDAAAYSNIYHNKYASYCGLARVLSGDRAGVELCRDAARLESEDGDVFLNLAYAEWHMKSRKRSIKMLEKGLEIDRKHAGLNKLQKHLGMRSKQVISFIARDSFLNKTLGKLSRKKIPSNNWTLQQLL
ncbi:MAG: hypothetical protein DIZ80_02795 [endosymbiont of Galathealinum brachiosum]|uniref:Tetratricopeptide repeat protein n=1 Tax=endosymbiont of Galathealinum brachiosum TaxID=2200906 RepID=A0A370DHP7_9GAMM|nr:MAG: hypothetical protein DIZ80_02795 [endosymbiont of Galathealinum brachiosum]